MRRSGPPVSGGRAGTGAGDARRGAGVAAGRPRGSRRPHPRSLGGGRPGAGRTLRRRWRCRPGWCTSAARSTGVRSRRPSRGTSPPISRPWPTRSAGSYRAVVQAMREAGIRPGEPVIEVGHSQGGLIAAQVAASGEFNSVATVTFGAPSGEVPVPDGVDTVAVEHSDDIVPGMGGTSTQGSGGAASRAPRGLRVRSASRRRCCSRRTAWPTYRRRLA